MADKIGNRKQKQLQSKENFRRNAVLLIYEMLELSVTPSVPLKLVEEALHSILFLAKINRFSPEIIFANSEELLAELRETYPRPFQLCSSQVPKRHPMSYILEMVVRVSGEDNENDIKDRLQQLSRRLDHKGNHLISSTMCVSQNTAIPDSVKYYGVSMSTSGAFSQKVMIAASCCTDWERHVAEAVVTFYPDKFPKPDFDGTIRLPKTVRCQAFRISTGEEIPPCQSCGNLFGLSTAETQVFTYGNCAETESLSNLFKNDTYIREESQPRNYMYTPQKRQQARKSAVKTLRGLLRGLDTNVFLWDNMFFPNERFEI